MTVQSRTGALERLLDRWPRPEARRAGTVRTLMAALLTIFAMATHADTSVMTSSVLELRQYKIFAGKREQMIGVFDGKLIEGQEELGMRVLGQFRDLDDPNRFTWLREFPNMELRARALTDFYTGPVWKAHRGEANPLLEDNDNVLLLKPATAALALKAPPASERAKQGETSKAAGTLIVTIYYLWKDPSEGFTRFFTEQLQPELAAAGVPVLGGYVAESTPNNFPALPVRQHEKVFVWFTRTQEAASYDRMLMGLDGSGVGRELQEYQERAAQVLRLVPTSRSLLR